MFTIEFVSSSDAAVVVAFSLWEDEPSKFDYEKVFLAPVSFVLYIE